MLLSGTPLSSPHRIYANSKTEGNALQYSTVAYTCGAAVVTLVSWVAELKNKLFRDGPEFFRDKVLFTMHRPKQARQ